ncbi:hypothetical protein FKM82_008634 [Ascaphus truei]
MTFWSFHPLLYNFGYSNKYHQNKSKNKKKYTGTTGGDYMRFLPSGGKGGSVVLGTMDTSRFNSVVREPNRPSGSRFTPLER